MKTSVLAAIAVIMLVMGCKKDEPEKPIYDNAKLKGWWVCVDDVNLLKFDLHFNGKSHCSELSRDYVGGMQNGLRDFTYEFKAPNLRVYYNNDYDQYYGTVDEDMTMHLTKRTATGDYEVMLTPAGSTNKGKQNQN